MPTFIYAIGKSIYFKRADFSLPWEHLQRIRTSVAPLLLGSILGVIHYKAGLVVSEPTDKYNAVGMLSSNIKHRSPVVSQVAGLRMQRAAGTPHWFPAPCSPVHSLEMVEALANQNRDVRDAAGREIFPAEYIDAIHTAKGFNKSLDSLRVQEFSYRFVNTSLYAMAALKQKIEQSSLSQEGKEVLVRLSGLLIPVLTIVDLACALIFQAILLVIGIVRFVTGRGPMYTEATASPLMQGALFMVTLLKCLGNLAGMFVWFVSPLAGFQVSLTPANAFFSFQMDQLMLKLKTKMDRASDGSRFILPLVQTFGDIFRLPFENMHQIYLIVEKQGAHFNLYAVNRPDVQSRNGLSQEELLNEVRSVSMASLPFMNMQKMLQFPFKPDETFPASMTKLATIADQGNHRNCVVSNLFGAIEAMDRIRGEPASVTVDRYTAVRRSLMERYQFYRHDFHPFTEGYSLDSVWDDIAAHPDAGI